MRDEGRRRGDAETRRRGEKKELSTSASQFAASPRRPNPASSLRVFCAIELPSAVRAAVADHIERLRGAAPDVRASWERNEKLHITMKFLGEILQDKVATLSDAASRAILDIRPFPLILEGTGSFPRRGTPKLLWLGMNDRSGELAHLQNKLEDACERVGFRREDRPFHPHLTIARIRTPQGARNLAQIHQTLGFKALEFPTSELVIMRSDLAPGGSRYSEISRHKFIAEAGGR